MHSTIRLLHFPSTAAIWCRLGQTRETRGPCFEALEQRYLLSAAALLGSGTQSSAADVSFSGFQGVSTEQTATVNIAFNGTPVVAPLVLRTNVALESLGSWQSPGDPTVPLET